MPRIPDDYLDCSIYLYASEWCAQNAKQAGASGLLVGMPSAAFPNRPHICAVTSRHAIEQGYTVLRLNTQDGNTDVLALEQKNWILSDEHDLAVCPLDISTKIFKYKCVDFRRFLTRDLVRDMHIGVGDDVFMVGRFLHHDGKQHNLPTARFGHIAMMPSEPVPHPEMPLGLQDSFLVEARTLIGYSGSPVFVYIPVEQVGFQRPVSDPLSGKYGPWLLGVEWGNLKGPKDVPSGMAGAVPAWHLADLLGKPELVALRKDAEEKLAKAKVECGTSLDSGTGAGE